MTGQPEWVDNCLTFGDLIEEHMGKEARDFYFENLFDLLSFAKEGGYFNDCVAKPLPIKEFLSETDKKIEEKQSKKAKVASKRLF